MKRILRRLAAACLAAASIALPLADPSQVSFALVEPPFEPTAIAEAARPEEAH